MCVFVKLQPSPGHRKQHPLLSCGAFRVFLLRHSSTLAYTPFKQTVNKSPFFILTHAGPFLGWRLSKILMWWMCHRLHLTHRFFWEATFSQRTLKLKYCLVATSSSHIGELAELTCRIINSNVLVATCYFNCLLYLRPIFDELQIWRTHHESSQELSWRATQRQKALQRNSFGLLSKAQHAACRQDRKEREKKSQKTFSQ